MAAVHKEEAPSSDSSETNAPGTTADLRDKLSKEGGIKYEDDYENLNYPSPWKFEKWLIGGYSQSRMLKFKKPKTMYNAINLFAGQFSMHSLAV